MDIAAWLRALGLEQYAPAFRDNDIDARVLPGLTAEDLRDIGITSVGHRRLLLQAIAALREPPAPAVRPTTGAAADVAAPVAAAPPPAERRQLTVIFVDLVGSTELSRRLDPEEMREIIRTYQNLVAGEVTRFEGYVAKYMGDGVLAYFGWPKAHEDAAERAVRAGLAVAAAVPGITGPISERLAARIGIATGSVVVGELVGSEEARERTVIGETPNLAARLQALARPGAVVIAEGTRRLLGGLFTLRDLGAVSLKGFAGHVGAFAVVGEGTAEGRFEALHGAERGLTPLVGREHELALLLDRWERVKEAEGQVVLLSGEAGIGKSRLVRALRERLGGEPHTAVAQFCSPYHVNTALHPVIGLLERAAGLRREDPPEVRLRKLEAMLAVATDDVADMVQPLADLLGIPTGRRYPPLELSPRQRKDQTFRALLNQLAGLAARGPVLALYEDVHWADPTTLELLGQVVERVQRLPVLALVTFRPGFAPPWSGHGHVTALSLGRLGRRQGAALVERVTGGKPLPPEVLAQVMARTDGVPLFVEELTKTVLESGLLADKGDRYELTGPLPPLAIPSTLHDSLMARLDRLAPVKEVAQVAACIGREFRQDLLAALVGLREEDLCDALDRLVAAELVFRRGDQPEASYAFKHMLVRDAAYESLLRSRRQQLHARIVDVMEQCFPETAELEPEMLAQHCAEGGLTGKAADYCLKAGRRALSHSAMAEAITQLSRGLAELERLPQEAGRLRQEAALQVSLGAALAVAKGWTAAETGRAYGRARELCATVGDDAQLRAALHGLAIFHQMRADLETVRQLGLEIRRLAERRAEPGLEITAERVLGNALHNLGRLAEARACYERLLGLYDPKRHSPLRFEHLYDPRAATASILARVLHVLGCLDQAAVRSEEALAEAERLLHPPTTAFVLIHRCFLLQFLGRKPALRTASETLIRVAREQGFASFLAYGTIFHGWSLMDGGNPADGAVERINEGLGMIRPLGHRLDVPYFLALLGDAHAAAGDTAEQARLVDEALREVQATGERWFEAELHRIRGELSLSSVAGNATAEECFGRAITAAREQEARTFELRAATSLSRLWAGRGRSQEARDLLAPVYAWFTEGFDTQDLQDAKALLDELGPTPTSSVA
jgi:class 3 adenylate cyclase/predicted ATPase